MSKVYPTCKKIISSQCVILKNPHVLKDQRTRNKQKHYVLDVKYGMYFIFDTRFLTFYVNFKHKQDVFVKHKLPH